MIEITTNLKSGREGRVVKKYICCNCGFRSRFQTTAIKDLGHVYHKCNNCDAKVYSSKTVLESMMRMDIIKAN